MAVEAVGRSPVSTVTLGRARFELDHSRFKCTTRSSQVPVSGNVLADEQTVAVDDERPVDHRGIGEVLSSVKDGVGVATARTGFDVSLGRQKHRRSPFVDRRPAWDDFAVPPKHAQPNPCVVYEIVDLI
jgi:hypothetical protein